MSHRVLACHANCDEILQRRSVCCLNSTNRSSFNSCMFSLGFALPLVYLYLSGGVFCNSVLSYMGSWGSFLFLQVHLCDYLCPDRSCRWFSQASSEKIRGWITHWNMSVISTQILPHAGKKDIWLLAVFSLPSHKTQNGCFLYILCDYCFFFSCIFKLLLELFFLSGSWIN